jgi:hypothetical protein
VGARRERERDAARSRRAASRPRPVERQAAGGVRSRRQTPPPPGLGIHAACSAMVQLALARGGLSGSADWPARGGPETRDHSGSRLRERNNPLKNPHPSSPVLMNAHLLMALALGGRVALCVCVCVCAGKEEWRSGGARRCE